MSTNVLPAPSNFWANLRRSMSISLPKNRSDVACLSFFAVMAVALTFLQKFAVVLDLSRFGISLSIGSVEVALPIFYVAMFALAFWVPFKVELRRLALFCLMSLTVLVSVAMQKRWYSLNSVMLMFAIYTPFLIHVDVKETTYRRMLSVFLNIMIVMGVITLLQHAAQLTMSYQVWPNLDKIVPDDFQFHNFNYIQPIIYGSRLMKPNAIFFLEVSVLSQWTAVALALEVVFFARIWRMAFYAVILVACFAGTGLLLLAMTGPVILGRVKIKTMAAVLVVVLVGVVVAIKINWYDQVSHRFDEYQKTGASANHRFVEPIAVMFEEIDKPAFFFTGEGPGTISKDNANTWWVVAKIAYEYGVLPTIAFSAFLLYVMFAGAPSGRMAFTYVMLMNFMGGFIIPVWPLFIFTLGGMFRIKESRSKRRQKRKVAVSDPHKTWASSPDSVQY
jgi:hypothetical protein